MEEPHLCAPSFVLSTFLPSLSTFLLFSSSPSLIVLPSHSVFLSFPCASLFFPPLVPSLSFSVSVEPRWSGLGAGPLPVFWSSSGADSAQTGQMFDLTETWSARLGPVFALIFALIGASGDRMVLIRAERLEQTLYSCWKEAGSETKDGEFDC